MFFQLEVAHCQLMRAVGLHVPVHMQASQPASIHIKLADGLSLTQDATLVTLTAPSVTSTTGLSFGGLTYDGTTDGLYTGSPVSTPVGPRKADNPGYDFSVAPLSMAMLTLPLH